MSRICVVLWAALAVGATSAWGNEASLSQQPGQQPADQRSAEPGQPVAVLAPAPTGQPAEFHMAAMQGKTGPGQLDTALASVEPGQSPAAAEPEAAPAKPEPRWKSDYSVAMTRAKNESKMCLVLFSNGSRTAAAFQERLFKDSKVSAKLDRYVLASVPLKSTIKVSGKDVPLMQNGAFSELQGQEGFAIVDFANRGTSYYGYVVSAFRFSSGKYYQFSLDQLPVIMDLPPGTLTQRTMIYAVRVHPERPASTRGVKDPILSEEATSQSRYQASIGVQGHHNWDSRFHRIIGRLVGRRGRSRPQVQYRSLPVEVVAESWPNQDLLDSAVDCVHSWRQSSGHWSAVSARHTGYGYDIRRGGNGIWYATGIFSN